jgi:hypothetical protein
LSAGQSQTVLEGAGILQESRGIRRNPKYFGGNTGIPVPQEFLQKNPVKVAENRNFKTPPKPYFCEQIPLKKKQKAKILRNTVFFCFSV